jgi:ABC-type cobalamin transport system ATPase subunit
MPVTYDLHGLEVRGFRGLASFDLEFPDHTPVYLIGANNCGKSTVLNSIALAFHGGAFQRFDVGEFDFFHPAQGDPVREFTATITFEAADSNQLPAVQGVGQPIPVHGVRAIGRTDRSGRFDSQNVLIGADGHTITYSARTPLSAAAKKTHGQHGLGYRPQNARLGEISTFLPEVWHLGPENLYPALFVWRTGPLKRLAQILSERFLSQEWTFVYRDKNQPMPATMKSVHGFFAAAVAEFPFWKDDLRPKLESALGQYLGRQAKVTLRPTIQTIEEWLTQQLAAFFASDGGGAATPLECMGGGWQTLVRLAALDVLRQFPDAAKERVVLLYEEPETFLHPHLRRKLRNVLQDLSQAGWVVVCSTHAPEFVSFQLPQQVVRLERSGDVVSARSLLTASVPAAAKLQEKLDEHGSHEMLFGNAVVLGEGKNDEHALRLSLEKAGVDLDGRSVSIVGVGSAQNLLAYVRIAKALGISWCAVLDEDKLPGSPVNPNTLKVRNDLLAEQGPNDEVALWPGKLELSLGLPATEKATPEWQEHQLAPLSISDLAATHRPFATTCTSVKQWLDRVVPG